MRHWIQNVVDRWKTTSPKKEEPKSDYNPNYDKYRTYFKDIYKKENEWKRNLQKRLKPLPTTYNKNINAANWTSVASAISNNISSVTPAGGSILNINGNTNKVEVKTALEVNGRDILKELDEMRDALLLLKRHVDMEEKYPRLKEIKDEYERTLEKYQTFETLKNSK